VIDFELFYYCCHCFVH